LASRWLNQDGRQPEESLGLSFESFIAPAVAGFHALDDIFASAL
jgi:hypothetical protein